MGAPQAPSELFLLDFNEKNECSSQRPPAQQNRFKAMVATIATPKDAYMWHTCSGPLQVGVDGKPFAPTPRSHPTDKEYYACKRSRRQQARLMPTILNRLPRTTKPKAKQESKQCWRSPPSRPNRSNDAWTSPRDDVSDHELDHNQRLDAQQQHALDALLSSDNESDTWHGYNALDEQEQQALEASLAELYTVGPHRADHHARGRLRRWEGSVR